VTADSHVSTAKATSREQPPQQQLDASIQRLEALSSRLSATPDWDSKVRHSFQRFHQGSRRIFVYGSVCGLGCLRQVLDGVEFCCAAGAPMAG